MRRGGRGSDGSRGPAIVDAGAAREVARIRPDGSAGPLGSSRRRRRGARRHGCRIAAESGANDGWRT
ncbi:hypothetical protein DR62_06885 [Burkholderia thailandensis]|uniref:Uncharacterized protein n=1 Tax=Burkholderia thailandensis TaxID=57975 RepID=A0AAW9CUD8_BURTH|nr:hypothetical protein DR62_06885 [Burkholderia thailandensis]AOI51437.1 hypothetical protein WI24_06210 [Burkholderia thailandensis]AOJ50464.1 hypothetical protein AQ475_06150 [Burkholderia thailandensis]AOJ57308.1 hypothetical protein AQ477_12940 [Burkholderia thailandensis]AVR25875.1 hypothetical protein A8H32_12860 [Burkholderia thailandensis]